MDVITQRPIYYDVEGDKQSKREERQKQRQDRNKEREGRKPSPEQIRKKEEKPERVKLTRDQKQEGRSQRREERKAKRTAKRLIKVNEGGKRKFLFPLTRVRNGKKKNADNTVTTVEAQNIVTIPNVGDFDKMEILKATKIDFVNITPETVLRQSTMITPASNPSSANESDTQSTENIVAIEVPEEKVTVADDGIAYASGDVNREEAPVDGTLPGDEKKGWWSEQKKATKVFVIAGSLAVVGTIVYLVIKNRR
jgi:hypothetical protein